MAAVGPSLLSKTHARQGSPPRVRGLAWMGDVTFLPGDTWGLDSLQSCCISLAKVVQGLLVMIPTCHLG